MYLFQQSLKRTTLLTSGLIAVGLITIQTHAENLDIDYSEEIIVVSQYLSLDKVNAVKTPTPILNIPQSLSIIDQEAMIKQAFANVGDALRYTPGLSISQGEGHRDAIIIRGNQSTSDFFLDGLRDDAQYYRPLYNLERIEILRGSNALLFGRGGGGGVINRVAKRPDHTEPFTVLSTSIDSFGAYSAQADLNRNLSDESAVRVNAFYENMDNHRDFFGGERFALNPTLSFAPSLDTNLLVSYEYLDDDRTVDRGVPSQNVVAGPDVPLEGYDNTFFGSPDENYTTLQAHILRGNADHKFSDYLRGNITVQYADYDKVYQNLYASEEVTVNGGLFDQVELDGYRDTTGRKNLIIQANLVSEFKTGPIGHTVLFGAEYGDQNTKNDRVNTVFAANGNDQLFIDFTGTLSIPSFSFTAPARDRASSVAFTSVYLQDQISLSESLKIVLAGRYDRFDIDVSNMFNAREFARTDSEITPRLGVIYKPQENISFYTSYSETFLPRSGEQFLTLNLESASTRPQFFENKEIGAKWDINDMLSLTSALYELKRESYTSVDPEDASQVIVIEGSKTQGLEIQLIGNITDAWYISTGYSYMNGKVNRVDGRGNDGKKTRQTPKHMFAVWNNVSVSDAFEIGLGATFQDSYFVREDNSVKVPSYIRFDAAAYYNINDTTRLQINVENLLNADYYPDAHSNDNISTGEPLNLRLAISTRF